LPMPDPENRMTHLRANAATPCTHTVRGLFGQILK